MGLQTRCPACQTVFGITPDLLARRHGMVRCGTCLTVFDGRQSLSDTEDLPLLTEVVSASQIDSPAATVEAPSPPPPSAPPPVAVDTEDTPHHWLGDPPIADAVEEHGEDAAANADEETRVDEYTGDAQPLRDSESDAATDAFVLDETDRRAGLPEFLDDETRDRRRHHQGLWIVLCLLALALMLLQLFWQQRDWIASWHPAVRGVVERLCDPLGCKVGYLRQLDRLQIVSSALQTAAPTADGDRPLTLPGEQHALNLTLRLRNGHHSPQPWPGIFLSLTDFSDTIVARKALLPADYLPTDRLSRPFAAMSSLDLSIPLTLDDLTVSGYRLELFFP